MEGDTKEMRSLALTPTWSVATVLTIFVVVSLIVERSIHRLSNWLRKTNRKPLLAAVEKMKEELMLLGFISLLLTATSSTIANICIPSKFYDGNFAPCTRSEIDDEVEDNSSQGRKLLMLPVLPHPLRRILNGLNRNTCKEGHEPFVSYQGLEQLHRFIFVMAITHISYSCLTMLLAIVKIHSWRIWEDVAHMDRHDVLTEINREKTFRRQTTFVRHHTSGPLVKNSFLIWVTCFFRQFGRSVVRTDYLTLRKGFIMNHNLSLKYDFHSYMIRSMEEEFQRIVGVSGPLWGFVVAFMLFNVKGSNLYFWIAIIPITLVLLVGAKLQHVIATLALETAGLTGHSMGAKLKPRDDLFWFKKPELMLSLIHFVLFQNAFELASFFWFWIVETLLRIYQLFYSHCIIVLSCRFAGQFLCSYSTLPLYALVTQMGTNYKAALIPQRIRDTIHGWGKAARRKRRHGNFTDDSTVHTDTSTVMSLEEDDHQLLDIRDIADGPVTQIELQPAFISVSPGPVANETSSRACTPLLRPSASVSSSETPNLNVEGIHRSSSMPVREGNKLETVMLTYWSLHRVWPCNRFVAPCSWTPWLHACSRLMSLTWTPWLCSGDEGFVSLRWTPWL
uniref:MLO-like protein n=1 Tax=Populus alba TaxID=43335 RepID=A0A4U5P2K0_POPAL|nr:MLO-like protein 11 [Populus alba]